MALSHSGNLRNVSLKKCALCYVTEFGGVTLCSMWQAVCDFDFLNFIILVDVHM